MALGLLVGAITDAVLADPGRGHPVALFGQGAQALESRMWADSRARGVAFTATCVAAAVATGLVAQRSARGPVSRAAVVSAATWAVLGGTTLRREARAVQQRMLAADLPAARERLTHLVGRDPSGLGESEIARAVVESVAENTSDAVVAPLFWGAVAGVPGLLGYRAVNTLDAMVGHRSRRYRRFGWSAARLDDAANLVPARVTAALVAVAAGRPAAVARVVRRDARRHPSPNAGWCESSFAAALGVRLGGTNVYDGRVDERPRLGDGRAPAAPDIARANTLAARVAALAVGAAVIAVAARDRGRRR